MDRIPGPFGGLRRSLPTALLAPLGAAVLTGGLLLPAAAHTVAAARVDFRRDVRPILSDKCFACHGPDEGKRKMKFRLDTKAGAFAELRGEDGFAIVPGDPG
ncbi:MAG TPA: c-type cytochrome domain-containing protein, partial [Planctomycetota bacterium]